MHVDLGLRDDGDSLPVEPAAGELVPEGLLELVADGALRVGPADVERHLVQLVRGELGSPQDEANLRAVAVPDRHPPAVGDERRDVMARLLERGHLVGNGLMLLVPDQRVAADRNHHEWTRHPSLPGPWPVLRPIDDPAGARGSGRIHELPSRTYRIVRAITAFWAWSRFSASS